MATLDDFDYIRFIFSDMYGIARGKVIPRSNVKHTVENGLQVYAGAPAAGPRTQIISLKKVEEASLGNAKYVAFPETLHILPSLKLDSKYRLGQIICEPQWIGGTSMAADPRFVARTQVEKLSALNMQLLSGYEMEFTIAEKETNKPLFDGVEALHMQMFNKSSELMLDLHSSLEKAGIFSDTLHTEYGPGQFEISLAPVLGIKSADNGLVFRNGVKEMCDNRNLDAYFMTKPFEFSGTNGCHFNHSVLVGGSNAFGNRDGQLSQVGRYWLAGLLEHMRALTAIFCPTPNCYTRAGDPWCPESASWGYEDRRAAVRVKEGANGNIYFENRLPSGSANPYLILAGTIAAGLDGIKRELDLPPDGLIGRPAIPLDLPSAMEELEKDNILVNALGAEFVEWYLLCKREIDLKEIPPVQGSENQEHDSWKRNRELYHLL